ncbi:MAG TPA: hypothetical protein VHT50_05705 [Mycobacterium sp.]|nr:hypothetical protein [Mycobacterium sp.]
MRATDRMVSLPIGQHFLRGAHRFPDVIVDAETTPDNSGTTGSFWMPVATTA